MDTQKVKQWAERALKVTLILGLVLGVLLFVMASLGGNSKALKEGLEQYLSGAFGGVAEIGTFNGMTFYPYMGADIENVNIYETAEKNKVRLSIDKAKVSLGFWDLAFSTGKVHILEISGVKAEPGVLSDEPIELKSLGVEEQDGAHILKGEGRYNAVPFTLRAGVELTGSGDDQKFRFTDIRPFELSIGRLKAKGELENLDTNSIDLVNMDMDMNGSVVKGDIHYGLGDAGRRTVELDLMLSRGTKLKADLQMQRLPEEREKITGDITLDPFVLKDYTDTTFLDDLLEEKRRILGGGEPGYDFTDKDVDLNVDVKGVTNNDISFFAMTFPLKIEGGILTAGPLESTFDGAKLGGQITMDTSKKPADLSIKIDLKDWGYGPLQQAFIGDETVKGSANIKVDLTSKGNSAQEFKSAMQGHLGFVGGEGEFPAKALNIWGGGLLNALLPDLSPNAQTQLNCMIGDFKAEGGVFETGALFMDTHSVTLAGEGKYNLAKDALDLQLTPKAKSIAIGDISSAVNVTGKLSDPVYRPSVLSLGKKIGGILLGAVNPAFLAYSLADFGLNEQHPCGKFLKANKE